MTHGKVLRYTLAARDKPTVSLNSSHIVMLDSDLNLLSNQIIYILSYNFRRFSFKLLQDLKGT